LRKRLLGDRFQSLHQRREPLRAELSEAPLGGAREDELHACYLPMANDMSRRKSRVLFRESRTGVLLRASRRRDRGGRHGTNVPLLRWHAFILSALIAGIAGGLWGHFITSFSPKAF
jgi:hypothetical protein